MVNDWWNAFSSLLPIQMEIIKPVIHMNNFTNIDLITTDQDILCVLGFYTITRDDAENVIKTLDLKE